MDRNARLQSQGCLAAESTSQRGPAVECARTGEARTRKFRRDDLAHLLLGRMEKPKPGRAVSCPRSQGLSAQFRINPSFPYHPPTSTPGHFCPLPGTGNEEGPAKRRERPNDPSGALCPGRGRRPPVLCRALVPVLCNAHPGFWDSEGCEGGGRSNSPRSDPPPLCPGPHGCLQAALLRLLLTTSTASPPLSADTQSLCLTVQGGSPLPIPPPHSNHPVV